jgi:hypothetical protein
MTTTHQRDLAAGEARDDKPCADCGHRMGAHRDWPVAYCYCGCLLAPSIDAWTDLEAPYTWRATA